METVVRLAQSLKVELLREVKLSGKDRLVRLAHPSNA